MTANDHEPTPPAEPTAVAPTFQQAFVADPAGVLAQLVASTQQPVVTLAELALRLVAAGVIPATELQMLGVGEGELRQLASSMRVLGGAVRVRTLNEAEDTAARDEMSKQVDEVLEQHELRLTPSERARLVARLLQGAQQLGAADLRVVYSKLVEAGIDPLGEHHPTGQYL